MVIYTHFCENLSISDGIPEALRRNLLYLKQLYAEQRLLVTTTSRLLKYNEVSTGLIYTVKEKDNVWSIIIQETIDSPGQTMSLTDDDLQGLTFYVDDPAAVQIHFQGQAMRVSHNSPDHTGRSSVSIPWIPLKYPRA
jgi:hypothetical protein